MKLLDQARFKFCDETVFYVLFVCDHYFVQ